VRYAHDLHPPTLLVRLRRGEREQHDRRAGEVHGTPVCALGERRMRLARTGAWQRTEQVLARTAPVDAVQPGSSTGTWCI
jgi:hypothetical protein